MDSAKAVKINFTKKELSLLCLALNYAVNWNDSLDDTVVMVEIEEKSERGEW